MRYVLVFLLVGFLLRETHAQKPTLPFEHLTTKDGLPSNEVWCITKDKQGFLWIGTGRSVCRYDGYTFRTPDDQKVGYCSGVSTGSAGMVYASVSTKGLCAIDPGTFTTKTILRTNYADTDRSNDTYDRAFVDSQNQIWLSDYTSVKRYDPRRKTIRQYALSSVGTIHQDATFFEDRQHRLWVISEIGLYRYDRRHDRLQCVLGREAHRVGNKKPVRLEMAFEDASGHLWLGGYEAGLIRYSPDDDSFSVLEKEFANRNVICGQESVDANGRRLLFVGTEKGLSLYYPDQRQVYHLPEFYDQGIHVKTIYDDKANGILWIGTRKGLFKYRYRNPGIRTVGIPADAAPTLTELTSFLQQPDGTYLLGLTHTGALVWQPSNNQFHLRKYPTSAYTYQLRWIQGRPLAFTDKGIFVGNATDGSFSILPVASRLFASPEFRDGLIDQKGRFWIANLTEGLKVVDPVTNTEVKLWPDSVGRRLCSANYMKALLEGTDGTVWVATCPNGLYFFDERQARFVNVNALPENRGRNLSGLCINALQRGSGGSLLIANWGGIDKLSPSGKMLLSFDFQRDKLADSYCSNLCEDRFGNLWFSTNEGIHIANPRTRVIKYLTTIEGLNSNAPVGFFKNGPDELLLGHLNSINLLNLNALVRAKAVPRIVLSSVEVKGKTLRQDLRNEIVLSPDANAITLDFSTLNFEPASKNLYRYQLDGFDSTWVDLGNQHRVSFTNLPAKSYTLRVRSRDSFGLSSDQVLRVGLTVQPYFTNTWWFKTLIGLVIAGLIAGLMRWRVATLAERNRLDLQITEWRLKALQSQMNPHFLFNSLNSVQNYLLTNRGLEGAKYLSKFSKLVRRIMENSNHQYLSFEQIIDTLRMYVEIESFRFNHEFTYTFDVEDDEALWEALLPPMLLQPYVENAIWHGLMPKEGKKILTISARIQQQQLVCTIEDNGVGRAFAPRTEGHVSRGQEMTRGIFESLRRSESEAKLDVIDLIDADGHPAGTRVRVIVPIEIG